MKKDSTQKIIVRFPPSPTGFMHIGNVRSCLYAWLLARQNDGKVILRIEDTDNQREVKGGVEYIKKTFLAVGLNWDEEFMQSKRLDVYKEWATKLVDKGLAYADNISPEEIEAWREDSRTKKKPFLFRNYITDDRKVEWVYGKNTLRLKSLPKKREWVDEVRGKLSAGEDSQDDLILIKSDGFPTYNFAHIIDDYLMGITHIFRADEFVASYPNYLNIYEALDIHPPKIVTCPPILASSGKKKLSKRDGAKSVLEYLEEGFLAEGLLNFLALMGWNPGKGNNQEIFTINQLIEEFSIAGIGKSGANYDEKRLEWINGHHIRTLSLDQLFDLAKNFMPKEAATFSEAYQKQVLSLVQERLKFLSELPELTSFFFKKPELTKAELLDVKGLEGEAQAKQFITHTLNLIKDSNFSPEDLQIKLNQALEDLETKPAVLFALLRNALTGARFTPPLNDTMSVLGKDEAVERLSLSIQ